MTHVGGPSAIYINPADIPGAARQVRKTLDENPSARQQRIAEGLENARRFSTEKIIEKYIRIYRELT